MLRRAVTALSVMLAAGAALPSPAHAQAADPAVVGEWACGRTRIYINAQGGIELLGDSYRAGRLTAAGGRISIAWDEGDRSSWIYRARGAAMTFAGGDASYECVPR